MSSASSIKGRKNKSLLKPERKSICVICEAGRIKKSSFKSRPIFVCKICKARKSLISNDDEEAKTPSNVSDEEAKTPSNVSDEEAKTPSNRSDEEAKTPSNRSDEEAKIPFDGLFHSRNIILPQPPAGPKAKSRSASVPKGRFFYEYSDDEDETDEEEEKEEEETRKEEDASLDFEPQTKPLPKKCIACFSKEHNYTYCPYQKNITRGVKFNHKMFEIHCECDCPYFDTDNWVCRSIHCGNGEESAMLVEKKCFICHSFLPYHHNSLECPNNKDLAAAFKAFTEDYHLDIPLPKEFV